MDDCEKHHAVGALCRSQHRRAPLSLVSDHSAVCKTRYVLPVLQLCEPCVYGRRSGFVSLPCTVRRGSEGHRSGKLCFLLQLPRYAANLLRHHTADRLPRDTLAEAAGEAGAVWDPDRAAVSVPHYSGRFCRWACAGAIHPMDQKEASDQQAFLGYGDSHCKRPLHRI